MELVSAPLEKGLKMVPSREMDTSGGQRDVRNFLRPSEDNCSAFDGKRGAPEFHLPCRLCMVIALCVTCGVRLSQTIPSFLLHAP